MILEKNTKLSSKLISVIIVLFAQSFLSIQAIAATTCTDENITLNNDNVKIGSTVDYTHSKLDASKTVVIKFDGKALPAITPIKISNYHVLSATVPANIRKLQTVVDLEVDGKLVCSSTLKILPIITSVTPNHSNIGELVTISGTGFDLSNFNNNTVTFNGIKAELKGSNANKDIIAVTPKSVTGPLQIETESGKSDEQTMQTIDSLVITGVIPDQGLIGDHVEIIGGNFSAPCAVKFNNVTAEIDSYSPNRIVARVPVTTSGYVTVETSPTVKSLSPDQFKVNTHLTIKSSDDNKLSPGTRRKLMAHTPGFFIKDAIPSLHFAPAGSTLRVASEEDKNGDITVVFTGIGKIDNNGAKPYNSYVVSEDTAYVVKANILYTEYPSKGYGFTSGILTVPYKYYPNKQELSGQPTVNGYLGYKIGDTFYSGYELSIVGSAGIGVVPITTTNADGTKSNSSGASFSAGWGFIMTVNKNFQVGIIHGWDWADKSSNYEFQGKPWIAVSLGTPIY